MSKILFPDEIIYEDSIIKINQDREVPIPGFFIVGVLSDVKSIDQLNHEEVKAVISSM